MMRLLNSSGVNEVRNQAVWALGNLAADCSVCREQVRSTGLLHLLVDMLDQSEYQEADARKIVVWCLANLLRGGINQLDFDVSVKKCISSNQSSNFQCVSSYRRTP